MRSMWMMGGMVVALGLGLAGCDDGGTTAADTASATDAAGANDATTMVEDTLAGEDTAPVEDTAVASDAATVEDTAAPPDTTVVEDTTVPEDTAVAEDTTIPEDTAVATDTSAEPDAETVPLPGFGVISGECGVLDTELTDAAPSYFVNHIDFGTNGWDSATELGELTAGGQEMWADGNAGGSSVESEIFAFEVLDRCELASLIKTETEVVYDPAGSKKTDILVEIDGLKIGVSVTRAVGFPFDAPYTVTQATDILTKKLNGIKESSANVVAGDQWVKQILAVLAYDAPHVESLKTAWDGLSADLKGDTILYITVTDGDDAVIY